MLKSDQQEKVLTTTTTHFNVNHEHLKDPFQKPKVWWIPTNKQWSISDTTKLREKNQTINHYRATPQKSDKAQPHHMSIWVHIRDTRRCLSNKRLTASNTHLKTKTRHVPNTGVLPWIRLHILSGIGGYATSSLQGFSVDKSHVAEMAKP